MIYSDRESRFTPPVQCAVLLTLVAAHAAAAWFLVSAVMTPEKFTPVRVWLATLAFSYAAEPLGVFYAWGTSRKKDTG